MSIIKKITFLLICSALFLTTNVFSQEVKKIGKYKDWETIVFIDGKNKVCFAQSVPVLQAPKKNQRDARLFVSFRPNDKISDEISITSGYESVSYTHLRAHETDSYLVCRLLLEKKMIGTLKKGSRIMVTGYNKSGSQTIDHYSLLGFSKAYNSAKKNCS